MQKTVLKVLNELQKDKPDLSYMRGLLEGLVDEETPIMRTIVTTGENLGGRLEIKSDEEETPVPAFAKPGPIGKINS